MNKRIASFWLAMAFLSMALCLDEARAGEGKFVIPQNTQVIETANLENIKFITIEILEIDTSMNKNSVKDQARSICKTFMQDDADTSSACLEAIESCATNTETKLKSAMNVTVQPAGLPRCLYKASKTEAGVTTAARWACLNDIWKNIQDEVTKDVNDTNKELIEQSCVLNTQDLGKTQTTTPAGGAAGIPAPTPEAAKDGFKPEPSISAEDASSSGNKIISSRDIGCALNAGASSSVLGLLGYVPLLLLMLGFRLKRK